MLNGVRDASQNKETLMKESDTKQIMETNAISVNVVPSGQILTFS